MAVTLHPLLSRKAEETVQEEQETVAVAEAPEAPVELAPEPTSEVSANAESVIPEALVVEPEPAPDPRRWIDPARGYYQELTRLEREDLEFKNAIRTRVGREAAKEWKPKVANLEAELAETRKQLQQERLKSLEPDEVKERLYQDPQFRKDYDQANNGPDAALIRERARFEARVTGAVEFAEQHLPPGEIAKRVNALQRGAYDATRDQAGNVIRTLTPEESISWFERDLSAAAIAHIQQSQARAPEPSAPAPAAPPQPQATAPAPAPAPVKSNPALAQSSPDLTAPTQGRPASSGMSMSQYQMLSTPQKMQMFPKGLADALQTGAVYREDE